MDTISTILLNLKESCSEVRQSKTLRLEDWVPPPFDSLKFNVDGSARGTPGPAGIGGVLRDYTGRLLCTFSNHIGIQDANTAEILAIARACELCVSRPELKDRDIAIVSDSKVAVSWVNNDEIGSLKHLQVIYDIRNLMRRLGSVSVSYSARAANFVADSLAKKGSDSGEVLLTWSNI
ncbi:hypothetical protein Dsin_013510 [Dipteronia sinensis]|uniref:RNase H type-1 domain-containing protein n=1 Tax=Dipteronia sinensis TaxID=43782 RepID=A0AAE0AKY7_9ROSI|nr:hypothetical protein Dsin_013510 [Dipteronia sinensis]